MAEEVFKGKTPEDQNKNACSCGFCITGGKEAQNEHIAENYPDCKCTCYCEPRQADTQQQGDTSETSQEAA